MSWRFTMIRNSSWGPESSTGDVPSVALPAPEITQDEIRRLQQYRLMARDSERLRKSLKARLQMGATVEPGPLHIRTREQTVRSLSAAKLTAAFGAEWVTKLKESIEPTVNIRIVIEVAAEGGGMQ